VHLLVCGSGKAAADGAASAWANGAGKGMASGLGEASADAKESAMIVKVFIVRMFEGV